MATEPILLSTIETPAYKDRDCPEGTEPCFFCGRRVNTQRTYYTIELANGGSHALHPDATDEQTLQMREEECAYMGFHPVGSVCRKLLPKGYCQKIPPIKSESVA